MNLANLIPFISKHQKVKIFDEESRETVYEGLIKNMLLLEKDALRLVKNILIVSDNIIEIIVDYPCVYWS
jgi:hypothetical protein